MSKQSTPRVVVVTRPSEYNELIVRHATRQQAEFFLAGRRQSLEPVDRAHQLWVDAIAATSQAIPSSWRRAKVARGDLSRFLFEPDDIVVAVGQDGLVANVAKYLAGQPVIGVNPDPESYDGILVPHAPSSIRRLLRAAGAGRLEIESRAMVAAAVDDGQQLVALNEIFIGHQAHQSARYQIGWNTREEVQSSSGIIVTTGTGATGWARSICSQRVAAPSLPEPTDPNLAFFVREAFPSVGTGTSIQDGTIDANACVTVVSQMNAGGVIFGDGIEEDRIQFHWGMTARIRLADLRLQLVR